MADEPAGSEIDVLDDALRASEADIAKLQGKLREARTRQNAIQSRLESANKRVRLREMYAGPKVDEAFSRFDVLERRADYAEGRADALALGAPPKTLDEEIAELRNSEKVDAELEALKAASGGRTTRRAEADGRRAHPDHRRRDAVHRPALADLPLHHPVEERRRP